LVSPPAVHWFTKKPAGVGGRLFHKNALNLKFSWEVTVDFEPDADFHECRSCPVHSSLPTFSVYAKSLIKVGRARPQEAEVQCSTNGGEKNPDFLTSQALGARSGENLLETARAGLTVARRDQRRRPRSSDWSGSCTPRRTFLCTTCPTPGICGGRRPAGPAARRRIGTRNKSRPRRREPVPPLSGYGSDATLAARRSNGAGVDWFLAGEADLRVIHPGRRPI
jgi:hypothetical protein